MTEDATAVAPSDYQSGEGTLVFADGQTTANIDLIIKGTTGRYEREEEFRIIISEVIIFDAPHSESVVEL